jgi:hypothetical protein
MRMKNKQVSTITFLFRDTNFTFMKFAEAAILLREISDRCPGLEGCTITLIPQKAMFPHYQGYHLNIKGNLSRESQGGLRKIVEGHDLMMQIKADAVIVFESRPT